MMCAYKHRHSASTDHIKSSEDVAVVMTGLEVFGDVGKCRQILWILSRTRDVTNFMLCYNILQSKRKMKKEKNGERLRCAERDR